jgi:hypothetical protein
VKYVLMICKIEMLLYTLWDENNLGVEGWELGFILSLLLYRILISTYFTINMNCPHSLFLIIYLLFHLI